MSFENKNISLINLSEQFPFEIDDGIKKQICFSETLVVSCVHGERNIDNDSIDSDWTCTESDDESKKEKIETKLTPVTNIVEEDSHHSSIEGEYDDFHLFFFPDCTKPDIRDSKGSLILKDGMPIINDDKKKQINCTCTKDKAGTCPCFIKLPCKCGAKTQAECTCKDLESICICNPEEPQLSCTCRPSNVCLCHEDGKPRPICSCGQIEKPCVCHPDKYPFPICVCENELVKNDESKHDTEAFDEETVQELESLREPCKCQVHDDTCLCKDGKECTCPKDICTCSPSSACICDHEIDNESQNKEAESISQECKCVLNGNKSSPSCTCFPKPKICTCGNPNNCKCFTECNCKEPCICDTVKEVDICSCSENRIKTADGICTCPPKVEKSEKLKRVRAGKHGYRWCHVVDPKHTFFDYGYDRHDKIDYKEKEKEKLKILGLYEEPEQENKCELHGNEGSKLKFEKKDRKPSIDCCSAVGGINFSVEALGEDKNKFLVQVVSNSSKHGAKCGSKLVSILDCNLHTLEENRSEHITKKNDTKERRSYMTICENGYYNKVTRICGERNIVKRIYHSFEDAHNFLLEGANVVLLRYFGISRYRGHVKTDTVLMDGTICESVYVCLGVSQAIVNGKPLFIEKVERHIIEPSGFIHQTLTVLTLRGYIVSHEWADSSYIFHLNPLLRIIPEKDEIEPHEPLREKWRTDLQLLSDYLDFKSTRSSEGARYVSENGELTDVIRDYLQTLLLLRPHDVLHFTQHYFGSALSELDLPHNEFFHPCRKNVRYYFFEE